MIEIARHFLAEYAKEEGKGFTGFDKETEKIINDYNWPGNIRQVQNVIRNIVVLHDGELVTSEMLPPPLGKIGMPAAGPAEPAAEGDVAAPAPAGVANGAASFDSEDEIVPLWKIERDFIERAIAACDGNIPKAAARLGISPSTIYRKKLSWESEDAES